MFNSFESSDERKRDAARDRRLMSLRCAYLAGYFDEEGSEPMPEIAADGRNPSFYDPIPPNPSKSLVKLFDYDAAEAKALEQWRSASRFLDRMRRLTTTGDPEIDKALGALCPTCGTPRSMFVLGACPKCGPVDFEPCPTCGRPRVMFVDGDCPGCNPPVEETDVDATRRLIDAMNHVCSVCSGFGELDGDDDQYPPYKCPACGGKGTLG